MSTISDVVELLDLAAVQADTFLGATNRHHPSAGQVFGGHVLAQALRAATLTLPCDRLPHSLHAYFIRPGDFSEDISYEVDRPRDGGAFSVRQVTARQRGEIILELLTSASVAMDQQTYGAPMPLAPEPMAVPPLADQLRPFAEEHQGWWVRDRPFELRYVSTPPRLGLDRGDLPSTDPNQVWLRTRGAAPTNQAIQMCLLAYATDMSILDPVVRANPVALRRGNRGVASLDHSIWFHAPFDLSQWCRYDTVTPAGTDRRGLGWGHVYRSDGTLAVSVAQEGLVRRGA